MQAASAKAAAARRAVDGWTPGDEAKLAKLVAGQEQLMKQMENAYDSIVDAKTAAEADQRRATLDALREQHNALDKPIAAANTAKAAAAQATTELAKACAANPFVTGCNAAASGS